MLVGHIPYGYRIEMGKIVIDEETGYIVKKVFAEYCSGVPQYKLKARLDDFITYTGKNIKGLSKQTISDMLRNTRYLGDEVLPQLIDYDVFEKAGKIRKQRLKSLGKDKQYNTMEQSSQEIFSGKIICGECGEIYNKYKRKTGRKAKKLVWDCSRHVVDGRIYCKNIDVSEEQLMQTFMEMVTIIKANQVYIKKSKKRIKQKESGRYRALDSQIKKAESFEKEYTTDEMIKMLLKRAALKYENSEVNDYDYYTQKIKDLMSEVEVLSEFDEKLFKEIVKNIVIFKDSKVKFILINGVEIEAQIATIERKKNLK